MGKRPRTPHFLPGIGDGNVHDGSNKEGESSRLRGNQGSSTDDENDANNNNNSGPSMPRKLRSAPGGWVITRRVASPPAENFFGESWV